MSTDCEDDRLLSQLDYLREENLRLGDRVIELEEAFAYDEPLAPRAWALIPVLSMLFNLLMTKPLVTRDMIMSGLYRSGEKDERSTKSADVYIFKLRKKLKGVGLAVVNDWGRGWLIPENQKRAFFDRHAPLSRPSLALDGLTDAHVEAGARALCTVIGMDPDTREGQNFLPVDQMLPLWAHRAEEARACIVAALRVAEKKPKEQRQGADLRGYEVLRCFNDHLERSASRPKDAAR